ncbi:hypothetical protein HDV00_003522 [Rhizophlyctis rosea]|nr:hypothetical protein HDV00_003522 [Rhizophlyctis rosea]
MHYQSPPIIHRDVKVENVLISASGAYKLCDFGSATTAAVQPGAPLSAQEIHSLEEEIGKFTTLQYRSPELCDLYQKRGMTEKVDMWALGVLLFKICFFTTPFEETGKLAILNVRYTMPTYPSYSRELLSIIALCANYAVYPAIYQIRQLSATELRRICHNHHIPFYDSDVHWEHVQAGYQ